MKKRKFKKLSAFVFLLLITNVMFSQNSLKDGLMAHYMLNGNGRDTSGSGNHGTVVKAVPATDRFNNQNSAYKFSNDINNYIEIANNNTINPDKITVNAWVKFTSSFVGMGSNPIIEKAFDTFTDPYYQYHIWVVGDQYSNETWRSRFGFSVSVNNTAYSVTSLERWTINKWYMLTGTYDGDTLRFYVNGELTESYGIHGTLSKYNTNLFIGRKGNDTTSVPAIIDDVRLYNRNLSGYEIMALYKRLNITSPKTRSSWVLSEPVKISVSGNFHSGIDIDYSTDNGSSWLPVAKAVTDSVYNWQTSNIALYKYFKLRITNVAEPADYQVIDSLRFVKSRLEKGLLAHYLFDSNARDTSSNAKHGTTTCSPTIDRNGENGKALLFGTGKGVTTPALDYSTTNQVTFCTWVKAFSFPSAYPKISSLMGTWDDKAKCLLRIGDAWIENNRPQFVVGDYKLDGNSLLETNRYYFIAATYDGATMRLYINGQLDASAPLAYSFGVSPEFYIGHGYNDRYLDGVLDEARVYNRCLSSNEIMTLYDNLFKLEFNNKQDSVFYTSQRTTIKWNHNIDSIASVNVKYSINDGLTWTTIANAVTIDTATWTTTSNTMSKVIVRIENAANPSQYVQKNFRIVTPEQYNLKLWLPLDGNINDTSIFNIPTTTVKKTYSTDRFNKANTCFTDTSVVSTSIPLSENAYTFSCWFNTTEKYNNTYGYLLLWGNFELYSGKNNPGKLNVGYYGGNTWNEYISNDSINDGKWHFIAITNDTSGIKIHLDTALVYSSPLSIPNSGKMVIGGDYYEGEIGDPFIGKIDEIKFYNRALTHDELRKENCHRNFILNAGTDTALCIGHNVTLRAKGNASSFQWLGGEVQDGISFVPAQTHNYVVSGSFDYGCTLTDTVEVKVNALPTLNTGVDRTVCQGSSITLTANSNAPVEWNNGIINGVSFVPSVTTSYVATATNSNNCINKDTVIVTVNALPSIDAGADIAVCEGNSVKLTANSNAPVAWNNGIINGVSFVPSVTTSYVATATNSNNCIKKDTVMVIVNALPTIDAGADVTVCQGGSVTLNAVASYPVTWNNNISDGTAFVPSSTGNYVATVTGNNGCVAADTVKITVNICTGIAENSISDHWVKLYPTLTNDKVFIQSAVTIEAVKVYSNHGRLMDCKVTNEYIDLSNVSTGVYLVKIQTNKGWINSKVVRY
jgi:hypothetical protein